MPVTVVTTNDAGGVVTFGHGTNPPAIASCAREGSKTILSTTAMLNEWPELRGRTVFTDVDINSGAVRVSYQDPVTWVNGIEVRPDPVVVYEGLLGRR